MLDSVGWYSGNSDNRTQPVGAKKIHGAGIFDMSGNVWEWGYDWYGDLPAGNAFGAKSGSDRVLRGGATTRSSAGRLTASGATPSSATPTLASVWSSSRSS